MRELRLIAAHRPRYNRRSRNPHRGVVGDRRRPRRSRGCRWSTTPRDGALGPFRSQSRRDGRRGDRARRRPAAAVHAAHPGPRGRRPPVRAARAGPLRRAVRRATSTSTEYAPAVDGLARPGRPAPSTTRCSALAATVDALAAGRAVRERRPAARPARRAGRRRWTGRSGWPALAALAEVVGARPDGRGGWELAVVRHGRLAAAGVARRAGCRRCRWSTRCAPAPQTVLPGAGPLRGAPPEEVRLLHRWLTTGGTRLVHVRRRRGPSPPAAPGAGRAWARARPAGRTGSRAGDPEPAPCPARGRRPTPRALASPLRPHGRPEGGRP